MINRKLFLLVMVMVTASLFIAVQRVAAQAPVTGPSDDEVLAVAKKLYCPVCPNTPLDVCETQACQDWRAQIKDQLASGWSEQQIIEYFVAQYGERVLAEPERKGFSSLVWVLPLLATLLGMVIVLHVLKNWRSDNPVKAQSSVRASQVSPEALAQIEKELKEME